VRRSSRAIFLRRGPWAWLQAGRDPVPEADAAIDDLTTIVEVVRGLGGQAREAR
jgi:hypothetical protein